MIDIQKVTRFALIGLFVACACPASQVIARKIQSGNGAATFSASGKIIAIGTDSFTIAQEQEGPPASQFLDDQHPATMTFMITRDTKIKGKLEVGASADVRYQEQDGNDVAVTVQVTAVT
jgi:hypothetical protein